jgi:hypothetical protein
MSRLSVAAFTACWFACTISSVVSANDAVAILSISAGEGFRNQCSRPDPPTGQMFVPSHEEVTVAESVLQQGGLSAFSCAPTDLTSSKRQYIGIQTGAGRVLYFNAFPSRISEDRPYPWRTTAYMACDGGTRFWGAVFDLDSGKFTEVHFDGGLGFGGSCKPKRSQENTDTVPSEAAIAINAPGW